MTSANTTPAKEPEGREGAAYAARPSGATAPGTETKAAVISRAMTQPPPTRRPFCVLMAGLPGSGKTTLSRALTDRGFVRLCPDEEMFRRHGVYGVDFPRGVFPTLERPVLEDVALDLQAKLKAGHDVVVDHGFWTPEDRAKWQAIATDAGAIPLLVYLAASHEELWARVSKRNEFHANDPNSIYFAESDLQRYRTRFVPPTSDEPHLLCKGNPLVVLRALQGSDH
ncbi:ATP-binding protein [Streptomyces sp. ITFR-16]|uniref:AAA family ATPase n=1 Tax=Streptomyces sp. ITFR-16 TaxID=3075198 RepID=UPI00288BA49B|nr:ATP-binding protein [Streptomyces sp. ITFR-16]WNI23592.1 ATP-binding protein [Streptomyces sp. ITFR-16]